MATYTVQHTLIAASGTPVTVDTFSPTPLLTTTATGTPSVYYTQGTSVTDVQLGGTTPTNRLLSFGAIA